MSNASNSDTDTETAEAVAKMLDSARALLQVGRFVDVEASMGELLQREEGQEEGWYFLAVSQRYLKKNREALASLAKLQALNPGYGRAWQEQGHVQLALGDKQEAVKAYLQAVRLNNSLIASWQALISLAQELKDADLLKDANEQHQRLAALPPEVLGVRNLLAEGKLLKAEQLCRAFLQKNPQNVEAMRLLADLGVKTQILDDAEFILESALVFEPDNPYVRFDYMNVLYQRQKYAKSLEQAKALLKIDPKNDRYLSAYANQCVAVGEFEEALSVYDALRQKLPKNAQLQLMRGHTLKTIGKMDEAVLAYQACYAARPNFGDAFWSLANLKTYRFSEPENTAMRKQVDASDTSETDKIHFCFALGKSLEDSEDFVGAADYYIRGNQLKKSELNYSAERMTAQLQQQQQWCNSEFVENLVGFGDEAADPIFIVGLPRAGSTLLEQILASHSQVDGTLELQNIPALAQRLDGRRTIHDEPRYPKVLREMSAEKSLEFGKAYIEDTRIHRQEAPYFIDKMPNNFRHIGLIHSILPNAKIIDARRHPLACCFSGFKQLFAEGQEFTYGLEEIGQYYRDYVELMDHWDEVLPGKVLRVEYENVVADLETQVKRILDFCGLPFEEACVNFHETERSVRTPSSEQVRQPIYSGGLEQWRQFDHCLAPLKEALGPVLGRYDTPQVAVAT
ncbi:MAG: tetratricopeptide (TPR) repeat protein [Halioglobus sp.]|jgi:tetratricopeptide (TPR) repeat protein